MAASGEIDVSIDGVIGAGMAEEVGTGPVERQRRPSDLEKGRAEVCDPGQM